jgi:hypothetical protein
MIACDKPAAPREILTQVYGALKRFHNRTLVLYDKMMKVSVRFADS